MKKDKTLRPEKTFPQFTAAFLMNDFSGIADKECESRAEAIKRFPAEKIGLFLRLSFDGFIDRQQLRRIVRFVIGNASPDEETLVDLVCAVKLMAWQSCDA